MLLTHLNINIRHYVLKMIDAPALRRRETRPGWIRPPRPPSLRQRPRPAGECPRPRSLRTAARTSNLNTAEVRLCSAREGARLVMLLTSDLTELLAVRPGSRGHCLQPRPRSDLQGTEAEVGLDTRVGSLADPVIEGICE